MAETSKELEKISMKILKLNQDAFKLVDEFGDEKITHDALDGWNVRIWQANNPGYILPEYTTLRDTMRTIYEKERL